MKTAFSLIAASLVSACGGLGDLTSDSKAPSVHCASPLQMVGAGETVPFKWDLKNPTTPFDAEIPFTRTEDIGLFGALSNIGNGTADFVAPGFVGQLTRVSISGFLSTEISESCDLYLVKDGTNAIALQEGDKAPYAHPNGFTYNTPQVSPAPDLDSMTPSGRFLVKKLEQTSMGSVTSLTALSIRIVGRLNIPAPGRRFFVLPNWNNYEVRIDGVALKAEPGFSGYTKVFDKAGPVTFDFRIYWGAQNPNNLSFNLRWAGYTEPTQPGRAGTQGPFTNIPQDAILPE